MSVEQNLRLSKEVIKNYNEHNMDHLVKYWVTEPIPATNKKIEFHICEISQWRNGKLKEIRAYVDRGQILRQLGIEAKVDWEQFG